MQDCTVKELMVPLSEYATVPKGATLFEAVIALENAQEIYDYNKYQHRAVLVLDTNDHVVGKLSQVDVLRALEPKNEQVDKIDNIKHFGFSKQFINTMREKYRLKDSLTNNICNGAMNIKVEECMQSPSDGDYVEENTSLDSVLHQFVTGLHLSLLVTREEKIVGVLRMSDVFAAVFQIMKINEKILNKDF